MAFAPLRDRVSATATTSAASGPDRLTVRHPIGHPNTQVTTDIGCDYGTRYRGRWTSARSDRASHKTRRSLLTATTRIALVELVPCPAQRPDLLRPDVQPVWVEVRGGRGHHNVSRSSATSSPTHLLVEPGSRDAVSPGCASPRPRPSRSVPSPPACWPRRGGGPRRCRFAAGVLASPGADRVSAGGGCRPASVFSGHPISGVVDIGYERFSLQGTLAGSPTGNLPRGFRLAVDAVIHNQYLSR